MKFDKKQFSLITRISQQHYNNKKWKENRNWERHIFFHPWDEACSWQGNTRLATTKGNAIHCALTWYANASALELYGPLPSHSSSIHPLAAHFHAHMSVWMCGCIGMAWPNAILTFSDSHVLALALGRRIKIQLCKWHEKFLFLFLKSKKLNF